MFFRKKRVRRDPYQSIYEAQRPIRLDEARLEAWALSVGQRRDIHQSERRSHRGMLPDVDLSQAVPAEKQPGLLRRLLRRLAGRPSDAGSAAEAAGEATDHGLALGETGRKPYVWLVEAESEPGAEASGPDEFEPSEPAVAYNGSRAA
jgi:hypothetical protein